ARVAPAPRARRYRWSRRTKAAYCATSSGYCATVSPPFRRRRSKSWKRSRRSKELARRRRKAAATAARTGAMRAAAGARALDIRISSGADARTRLERARQLLEISGEFGAEARMLETVFHGRLQVSELAAAVVALALELKRVHRLAPHQLRNAVRQLYFAARAFADLREVIENGGGQQIAADHREVGFRLVRLRFLDDVHNFADPLDDALLQGHDAVFVGILS